MKNIFIILFISFVFYKNIECVTVSTIKPAKSSGLGDAFTGISDGLNSIFYNPAGVSVVSKKELLFTLSDCILDSFYGSCSIGFNTKNNSVWAFSYTYFDCGKIEVNYPDGKTETLDAEKDFIFIITSSRKITQIYNKYNITFGINLKNISATLAREYKYNSILTDIGLKLDTKLDDRNSLETGFAVKNINILKSNNINPPQEVSLGFSYSTEISNQEVCVALDICGQINSGYTVNSGVDISLSKSIKLRTGYKIGHDSITLSSGTGIEFKNIIIDFSVSMAGNFGYIPYISTTIKF